MGKHDHEGRRTTRYRRAGGLLALALFGLLASDCPAAAIRRNARNRALAASVSRPGSYWDRYFTRALREQRLNVRGPNALRVLSLGADGTLPDSAFVEYLRWRRSLNPARFDHYHPGLGPILAEDPTVRPTVVPPDRPGTVNPPPTPPPPDRPPVGPEVPEPPAAAIAIVLIGFGAWARRSIRPGR